MLSVHYCINILKNEVKILSYRTAKGRAAHRLHLPAALSAPANRGADPFTPGCRPVRLLLSSLPHRAVNPSAACAGQVKSGRPAPPQDPFQEEKPLLSPPWRQENRKYQPVLFPDSSLLFYANSCRIVQSTDSYITVFPPTCAVQEYALLRVNRCEISD